MTALSKESGWENIFTGYFQEVWQGAGSGPPHQEAVIFV